MAIETATETVGVAVRRADGVQAEFVLTGRRRHVETLTPALEHVLAQLELCPDDVGLLAVDVGPGLFTGLRVGVAVAKALAQARGIGVVGVTSLDVLAAGAADAGHRGLVLSCVDVRRGEVFAAVHDVSGGPVGATPVLAAGLFAPGTLVDALGRFGGLPLTAVGDGALRYAAELAAVPGLGAAAPALGFPPPASLLALALARTSAGKLPADPAAVVPLYLRDADARVNFERADRPAG